jgi:uncharacterized DUF497 family protein
MAALDFAWDPAKARANVRKHGVSFVEAQSVFFDGHARLLDDPDHSETEDRFILMGLSSALRVLVVVHAYREGQGQGLIWIVSARKATPRERAGYEPGERR